MRGARGRLDAALHPHRGRGGLSHGHQGREFKFVVIVKTCVNKQAGSLLAAQEWTINQKPGQQVDPTLDMKTTHKFPLQEHLP